MLTLSMYSHTGIYPHRIQPQTLYNHTFSGNQVVRTAPSLAITTATLHITTAQTPGFVIISGETNAIPRP